MSIERYDVILDKNPREILLLKSKNCKWGRCSFCDYIHDNSEDLEEIIAVNQSVLKKVTGQYGQLEIINSGSCFELPEKTLEDIKHIVEEKNIQHVYFESHWMYRHRLGEIRNFFNVPITFKCGVETFDDTFRNEVLKKGMPVKDPMEIRQYFNSICLMVGIKGQTKEMIKRDMELLLEHFERGCINIFIENSTDLKRDDELVLWFKENYGYLEKEPSIEILWNNTDFGVGGESNDE